MRYLILLSAIICLSCAPVPRMENAKVLTVYTVDRGITKEYHIVVIPRADFFRLPRLYESIYLEPNEYRILLRQLQEGR